MTARKPEEVAAAVSSEQLFHIEVETGPLNAVIGLLNDHLKRQDERIRVLESELKLRVRKQIYDEDRDILLARVSQCEGVVKRCSEQFVRVADDVHNMETRLNMTLTERLNENLVSLQMQIRTVTSALDEKIQILEGASQQHKRRIDELSNRYIPPPADEAIARLSTEIRQIHQDIAKLRDDLEHIPPPTIVVQPPPMPPVPEPTPPPPANEEPAPPLPEETVPGASRGGQKPSTAAAAPHASVANALRATTAQAELADAPPPERSGLRLIGNLPTVDPVVESLGEELRDLQEEFGGHQKNVVLAMNAIRDEFQLIRTHGKGLQNLPPLNLANVVPSFFNNPSFRYHEEEEATAPELTREPDAPAGEPRASSTRSEGFASTSGSPLPSAQSSEGRSTDRIQVTGQITASILKSGGREIEAPPPAEIDVEGLVGKLRTELNVQEMRQIFEKMHADHVESLSALDRKIDRDYVERLFDKFRLMIVALGERVREVAAISDVYATREDVEMMARVLKKLADGQRPATALKRGPGCLFCGRPKTSITGQISPRTAAMAGAAPVRNVLGDSGKADFVYGDGQAFKRDAFSSFPHLNTLPKLDADAS
jgi:hypothetical protein